MTTSKWPSWKLALAIGLPVATVATVGAAVYLRYRQRPARQRTSREHMLTQEVVERDYPNSLCQPAAVVLDVTSPRYMALSKDGDLFVSSSREHCVFVYDSRGKHKATIGSAGTGELQFKAPRGLAIIGDVVYVVESGNHRVQSVTTSGKFLGLFGSFGSSDGEFNQPVGICASPSGALYVSDCGNDRIQVFNSNGRFSHSFGSKDLIETGFVSPCGMAFSPNGNIHVAAYASDFVLIFTPEGQYVKRYKVKSPADVAIDAAGFALVTSLCNQGFLSVFDSNGHLVHTLEGLDYPCGVIIGNGSVWVADRNNHQILKY